MVFSLQLRALPHPYPATGTGTHSSSSSMDLGSGPKHTAHTASAQEKEERRRGRAITSLDWKHAMEKAGRAWKNLEQHLNFWRIHLISFTLTPVIVAAIFYASNGRFKVPYVDALFVCISAMTGTGLATIDLSSLTAWQQAILVILQLVGSPITVAWVAVYVRKRYFVTNLGYMITVAWVAVYVRKRYFVTNLGYMVKAQYERTQTRDALSQPSPGLFARGRSMTKHWIRRRTAVAPQNGSSSTSHHRTSHTSATRAIPSTDIIRRADEPPIAGIPDMDFDRTLVAPPHQTPRSTTPVEEPFSSSPEPMSPVALPDVGTEEPPRVSFQTPKRSSSGQRPTPYQRRRDTHVEDRGGFGNPFGWVGLLLQRTAPAFHRKLERSLTMPVGATLVSAHGLHGNLPRGARKVPYFSFNAKVRKNSHFGELSEDDCEELGGVEFRALNALLWLVPLADGWGDQFYFGTLALGFVVVAPYMSLARWNDAFLPPNQHRVIDSTWYSAFEVVGAWANTGMSLVDQNLIPFQRAYPLLVVVMLVAIAGSTGFPVIWSISRFYAKGSQFNDTLHFLLDHPRRCFIYLFPSRQTWFLLTVVIGLNLIDWAFFLILNIGIPEIEAIPVGVRVLLGAVQAVAVRLSGFQSVSLAVIAPALKALYLVMMYVAAYPVAMSVRATNVYEEKSLGIFEEEDDAEEDIEDEADYPETDSRVAIWGRYLGRHARRQLSFGLALFLLCIIERDNIRSPDNDAWFNLFNLIFELVSAYSTVGLSFGIPTANYSLSGAFHTLSKLILCAVMIRGRHRGLPVAVDRAVLLPREFSQKATEKVYEMKRRKAQRGLGLGAGLEPPQGLSTIEEERTL
ncbi:cation transport protein-domain-containing protein [Amylostereum chailletii]|nr:cation transport protein-domain-containing protein [Amylostereum chailletii]